MKGCFRRTLGLLLQVGMVNNLDDRGRCSARGIGPSGGALEKFDRRYYKLDS